MIFLCNLADVPPGRSRRVARGPKPAIAVFNVDGTVHATDDKCTHGTALLSRGRIAEGRLICPLHHGSFDLKTGTPIDPPCSLKLRIYQVEIRDGQVFGNVGD